MCVWGGVPTGFTPTINEIQLRMSAGICFLKAPKMSHVHFSKRTRLQPAIAFQNK